MVNPSRDEREPVEVLAEEFLERRRRGERPSLEEYVARYPDLAEEIRDVFPALVVMDEVDPQSAELRHSLGRALGRAPILPEQLGDYRLLRRIGQGGMGVVYEAEQVSLGRRVALKVLTGQGTGDARARERFRREARSAARLHHTNIVPVFEVGQDGDTCYYAMQFIPGQGLDQVIHEVRRLREATPNGLPATASTRSRTHAGDGAGAASAVAQSLLTGRLEPTPPSEEATRPSDRNPVRESSASSLSGIHAGHRPYFRSVARIGQQAALALAHAHARGIIHRDVKPSNLLLDEAGVVWVTDFGLAKTEDDNLTRTGDLPGTLRYMAPERFEGRCDGRADTYALGLTLYELLVLAPAFPASDRLHVLEQIRNREPPRPRLVDARVPRDLETIVLKAIEKDPARRYRSANELAEDLRRFLADEPIQARQVTAAERLTRWCRRNPVVAGLLATVAATLLAGSVVAAFFAVRANDNAQQAQANEKRALDEKAQADQARREADQAGRETDTARRDLQQNLYYAEMSLAGRAAEAPGGLGRIRELLEHWRPQADERDRRGWEWYYLRGLGSRSKSHLLPYKGPISWSPDGRFLAVVSVNYMIRLWDLAAGREHAVLRGHRDRLRSLCWSPDGRWLASGASDGTARLWEPDTGREVMVYRTSLFLALAVCWSPDGRLLFTLSDHGDRSRRSVIQVWDAETGREIRAFPTRMAFTRTMSVRPRSSLLAVAETNGAITLWDADTGREAPPLEGETIPAGDLAWSPDGRRLAAASDDQTVRLLDPETRAVTVVGRHAGGVVQVRWSPDGTSLASAGEDGAVKVWDASSGRERFALVEHAGPVNAVAWSPDGRRLASADTRGIQLWETDRGQTGTVLVGHTGGVAAVAWSPDGRRLASAGQDRTVRVWGPRAGDAPLVLRGHTLPLESLGWRPDGRRLASGSDDGTVRLWDPDTGRPLGVLRFGQIVTTLAWAPDGRRLAIAGFGPRGSLELWDADRQELLRTFPLAFNTGVGGLTWSRDGRQLANGHNNGTVQVWDTVTGGEPRVFRGHLDGVRNVAFSPDGRTLASSGGEQTIKLWDVATGQEKASFRGHTNSIGDLAWSPDGGRLASGSSDGTARVWDVEKGKEAVALRGLGGRVGGVSWNRDGLRLACGGGDGRIRIWDACSGYAEERNPLLLPELDYRLQAQPVHRADFRLRAEIQARRGAWPEAVADWERAVSLGTGGPPWFEAGCWLAGPFAEPADASPCPGTEPDPLRPVSPLAGDTGKSSVSWQGVVPTADGCLDLAATFPQARAGMAYALMRVYSPRPQPAAADITASGGVRSWLNGESLPELRPQGTGEDEPVPLTLRSGWNSLLVQVRLDKTDRLVLRLSAEPAQRVRALADAGRWEEGQTVLQRLLEQQPNEPRTLLLAGRYFRQCGERARREGRTAEADRAECRAQDCLEKLVARCPDHGGYAAELADILLLRSNPWEVLRPTTIQSAHGTTLTALDDGSILAGGANPHPETYTITATTRITGIRGVRLEVLTDPNLPRNGPGRAGAGNFVLNELRVRAASAASPDRARQVQLHGAWADFSQDDFPVAAAIDGDRSTGWAVGPEVGAPHLAIFEVKDSPATGSETVLTFKLEQRHTDHPPAHNLGRFRLSVTARPRHLWPEFWRSDFTRQGASGWTRLAAARCMRGEWSTALAVLSKSTARPDRGDGRDRLLLILVREALGQADAARKGADDLFAWVGRCGGAEQLDLVAPLGTLDAYLAQESPSAGADVCTGRARIYLVRDRPERALAEADRAVRLRPESLPTREVHAECLVRLKKWGEAVTAYTKLVELKPDDDELREFLGHLCARCGKWAEAADLFAAQSQPSGLPSPELWRPWYCQALAQLAAGNLPAYRKTCAGMLARFRDAQEWETAFFTAWSCSLGPDAVPDLAAALRLAERVRAQEPGRPQAHLAMGAVLYRLGRPEEALPHFRAAAAANNSAGRTSPAYWCYFEALARHRLGHPDEARTWLERAVARTEEELRADAHGGDPTWWVRDTTLRLLRAEAQRALRKDAAKRKTAPSG
jgi:WD40 repeat protein/serine/threonine protein kinase/tetratricopeptide (TPR) repeat protein